MELSVHDLFLNGRTSHDFKDQEVPISLLEEIYDITKFGPTSGNGLPLRIKFIISSEAKEKLLSCVSEGNIASIKSAPVTAIFAYDIKFYEKMNILFAHNPSMQKFFANNTKAAEDTAYRNSTLQAAYFMIVARSKGLGVGPMSGFNAQKLEELFLANSSLKPNFICTIGYPLQEAKYSRLPRLKFEDVCEII